jgi:hypothetical protein
MVEPGSTIRADGWRGYARLGMSGYSHYVVPHKESMPGEDPTPFVHRVASLLKRWLLGTHQGGQQFTHLHYITLMNSPFGSIGENLHQEECYFFD